jgi:uncharacterized protein (UPF0210 family)
MPILSRFNRFNLPQPSTVFRVAVLALLLSPLSITQAATQSQAPLLLAKNLQSLAHEAQQHNIPIGILFSYQGLKSTQNLKELALLPALSSAQFTGKALFTEIQLNDGGQTIDFYSVLTDNQEFKALYNLTSLPVLIFVNPKGEPIAEPLLSGAYDFYVHYLQQHLEQAQRQLTAIQNQ